MLENNLKCKTTKRCMVLFPEVHHPLRNDYISVEELVKENSHNGSLSATFLLSTKAILSTKRQDHNLTNFPLLTTSLGASQRRLGVKSKCTSYGNALVSSQRCS
jgi:hypothetical protein